MKEIRIYNLHDNEKILLAFCGKHSVSIPITEARVDSDGHKYRKIATIHYIKGEYTSKRDYKTGLILAKEYPEFCKIVD